MSNIKVYIGCCKTDLHLLRSCVASIRYWNKVVPIILLKDLSRGSFDTVEMEQVFNIQIAPLKYNKLGGYIKLQPYIEHPDERIFLQDADMVWLGDMLPLLNKVTEDIGVHAYIPDDFNVEANKWYFKTDKLKTFYPNYKYPGFLFNGGSILLSPAKFLEEDFTDIIVWKPMAVPIHPGIFLCEDQGIINYLTAVKLQKGSISVARINLQISSDNAIAKLHKLVDVENKISLPIIVHWIGNKNGLNRFYQCSHLLRFFEKQYFKDCKNGAVKLVAARLSRTVRHFDKFLYEAAKKFYYFLNSTKK